MFLWHREHPRRFPWRETNDPFEVAIGEILLQRTRGEHVEMVYRELLRCWPTPVTLSKARVTTIEKVIRPLGLPRRAALIQEFARRWEASVRTPQEPSQLLELPGIGPYGAHAVPIFARNRNLPLVDWVIARVLRRYFGLPSGRRPNADKELWDHARWLIEPGRARELWLGTLDFAAAVCKPHPLCATCPLASSCCHRASVLGTR